MTSLICWFSKLYSGIPYNSNLFFRALLLGLACNQNLKEVFLDLSNCEVGNIYKWHPCQNNIALLRYMFLILCTCHHA